MSKRERSRATAIAINRRTYRIQGVVPVHIFWVGEDGLSLSFCPTHAPGGALGWSRHRDEGLDVILAKERPFEDVHSCHGAANTDRHGLDPKVIENHLMKSIVSMRRDFRN